MTAGEKARGWRFFRRARREADDRPPGDTRCRNCGADAPGAFCPSCGQETRITLPRATQFMREAAGRYVAFDGKMWRTLSLLLFRPGFLTREYLAGRRVRYVRPARLVLVLAIVLFAAIRLTNDDESILLSVGRDAPPPAAPSASGAPAKAGPAKAGPGKAAPAQAAPDAAAVPKAAGKSLIELDGEPLTIGAGPARIQIDDDLDINVAGIESPWGRNLAKRFASFNRLDRGEKIRAIVAGMIRFGPYALIALLPAFALLMQVLYLGRARRYPHRPRRYAEHLVYGAHSHAFVALLGTLAAVVATGPLTALLALWGAVYLPWSMHAVYGGRWIGVFARALVASIVYLVLFALAIAGLVVVAVLLR